MSRAIIRRLLETRLDSLEPKLATAWENKNYAPVSNVPFQEVYLLFADPENPTMGDDFYRQRGYLQVNLRYPLNQGPGDADERGDLLAEWFKRGWTDESNGVKVSIDRTPEIASGSIEGDRYVLTVRIRFRADIQP